LRFGLGPVFEYDCITGARRWRLYATRVFFLGALLAALVIVWLEKLHGRALSAIGRDAEAGEKFFYAVVGTELTLMLLLAPVATASAICVDKMRGTLAHMLVTDLSDFEIVAGRLAARFLPVLGLVVATAPLLFLGVLLGGIDPDAVLGSLIVLVGTAMLAAAIAMALSVWCRKTHEVLVAAFAVIGLWLLAGMLWVQAMFLMPTLGGRPMWLENLNPFYLAFAPYRMAGAMLWPEYVRYIAMCGGLSLVLTALAVRKTRSVYVMQFGGSIRRKPAGPVRRLAARLALPFRWMSQLRFTLPALPGPTLDSNPVLWREWRRAAPSRFARLAWAVFAVIALASTVIAVVNGLAATGRRSGSMAAWVNALQVSVGLLLLCVSATTSLGEERDRGTLDLLLSTPLSTASIVWGKWWGTYRRVPILAVLPTLLVAVLGSRHHGAIAPAITVAALVLIYGASVTSLGLAVSTWVKATGRGIAITVALYVGVCVGWLFIVIAASGDEKMASLSPFMGVGNLTWEAAERGNGPDYSWPIGWSVPHIVAAVGLYAATRLTFDRRLGRIPDRSTIAYVLLQAAPSEPWAAREVRVVTDATHH
jgi:ABC-type transport system involved in multi-copper enzyme maturation permease subunit